MMPEHQSMKTEHRSAAPEHQMSRPYLQLLLMALLSFASMYALMYAMVARFADIYANFNQFYMAALMAAPMVAIELVLMGHMYKEKRKNALAFIASGVVLAASFLAIRAQAGISDDQFLRSMIPHHSGAVLMCKESAIEDPRIEELCRGIIAGQEAEIAEMKALLAERE